MMKGWWGEVGRVQSHFLQGHSGAAARKRASRGVEALGWWGAGGVRWAEPHFLQEIGRAHV